MTRSLNVLIVEDRPDMLANLVQQVSAIEGIASVKQALTFSDGETALTSEIDLLLTDLELPDGTGLDLIAKAQDLPGTKTIVITVFGDESNVLNAIRYGADGYILKDARQTEIVKAIEDVLNGVAPISPAIAGHLLNQIRADEQSDKPMMQSPLTERETSILETLAKGFSYKEIGEVMNISYHTVNDHLKVIYRKLSVNSRSEAVYEAIKSGFIDP